MPITAITVARTNSQAGFMIIPPDHHGFMFLYFPSFFNFYLKLSFIEKFRGMFIFTNKKTH
jgi:hypothetical protein